MTQFIHIFRILVVVLGTLVVPHVRAQDFPQRPIKIIAHIAAGGSGDAQVRFVAERMSKLLNVPIVIENRTGAGGLVAAGIVKSAPADGYTLLLQGNPGLNQMLTAATFNFDAEVDFRTIGGLTRNTLVFAVPPDSKLNSVADIISVKAGGKPLNVGISATGYYLVLEWFSKLARTKFSEVRYQGSPQMMQDLATGRLDWAIVDLASALPRAKAGQIRIVAVIGNGRHPSVPDVPTVKESGYPEFIYYAWNAVFVRSETPEPIKNILAEALRKVLSTAEFSEFVKRFEAEKIDLTPVEFQNLLVQDLQRYRKLAQEIGFKAE